MSVHFIDIVLRETIRQEVSSAEEREKSLADYRKILADRARPSLYNPNTDPVNYSILYPGNSWHSGDGTF